MVVAKCHPDRQHKALGWCKPCYERNSPHAIASRKRHRKSKRFLESRRTFAVKWRYGITFEQYDAMLNAQNGGCAICGDVPKLKSLHIDHDHSCCPGKRSCGKCIRGLLCGSCNWGIAYLKDSPLILRQAENYLSKFSRS